MVRNFGGHPSLPRIFQTPPWLTVSNFLVRSMKATYRSQNFVEGYGVNNVSVDLRLFSHIEPPSFLNLSEP